MKILNQTQNSFKISTLLNQTYCNEKNHFKKKPNFKSFKMEFENKRTSGVLMKMDMKGNIYYVVEKDGQCCIFMIQPQLCEQRDHICIWTTKSDECLAFDIQRSSQVFYFIDNMKIVHKLEMMNDRLRLIETDTFYFKQKEILSFKKNKSQDLTIIRDGFMIHQNYVFYMFKC